MPQFNFPPSTASIEPSNPYYHGQSRIGINPDTGYYITKVSSGLPDDIDEIKNYDKQVRAVIESENFTKKFVDNLTEVVVLL